MRMPWRGRNVPHGALDLLRGCNIRCKGCYNVRPQHTKTLDEIAAEMDLLLALRRLHTVTLSGGEATLHPQLPDIVRMVRRRGVHAALITNGLRLDDALLRELKDAGLEVVFLHIQSEQVRADLPPDPTAAQVLALRRRKAEQAAMAGLDVGYAFTVFRGNLHDLPGLLREMFDSPHVSHTLVTEYGPFDRMGRLTGDVSGGLRAVGPPPAAPAPDADVPGEGEIAATLQAMGLRPFSYVPSNVSDCDPRWLSYTVAVVQRPHHETLVVALRAALVERLFIRLARALSGRYPFYHRPNPRRFRRQLVLNALSGGRVAGNLHVLGAARRPGAALRDKHIVFQRAPALSSDGRVLFCRECPDATIRDGRLVPSCLSDRIVNSP